ncbi:hypothetical protein Tco_0816511 [Tanacetum coccineum]
MINTKKLLDSVMLDKLKLDGEVEIDEEEATQEVIRSYNTIREKERPRSFHSSYPYRGKSDEDEEEYRVKRDEMGKPIYCPKFAKYLNCDDLMDRALAL